MNLPTLIVEFGQQRQQLTLKKFHFTLHELWELFARIFQTTFDLQKYEILFSNQPINSSIELDFTQMEKYPRFRIRLRNNSTIVDSSTDEINLLKQRLNKASMDILEVTSLIKSIQTNCQNLIQTLVEEDQHSNTDERIPSSFKPLSTIHSTSVHNSPSTDEGIDRDIGSTSIFESAYDDDASKSIYLECREDVTLIDQPIPINNKENSRLEWRNQPYRSRAHWNDNNQVKYSSNYSQNQSREKPRLKKTTNPNKAPLPQEKKKNIPCKYAAGGNCKRGNQCRFIHVV